MIHLVMAAFEMLAVWCMKLRYSLVIVLDYLCWEILKMWNAQYMILKLLLSLFMVLGNFQAALGEIEFLN